MSEILATLVPLAALALGATSGETGRFESKTLSVENRKSNPAITCIAGDKLALYPIELTPQEQAARDEAYQGTPQIEPLSKERSARDKGVIVNKRYYIFSLSGCLFQISGVVPTGFPYVKMTSSLVAKINLNNPLASVVELISEKFVPARDLEFFCDAIPIRSWRGRYATLASCEKDALISDLKYSIREIGIASSPISSASDANGYSFGRALHSHCLDYAKYKSIDQSISKIEFGYLNPSPWLGEC